MLETAKDILRQITVQGFDALIVGGPVRDLIMGMTSSDIDLATNMPIEMIENMWPSHEIGQSKDFGILAIHKNGHSFEIAQFRTEEGSSDHRRPKKVTAVDSFEVDASRRDFTINAMGMDFHGNIFDFFGGCQDIKDKILRTVGDPETRFNEDFLRMIRACRFASRFGFVIEKDTKRAIKKLAHKINKISSERIRMEIVKIASDGKKFARFIELLDETGLLKFILPEIEALKWINNPIEHHPEGRSVFAHVMVCLRAGQTDNPIHNIAILLHDLGKLTTGGIKEGGIPTFNGHDKAGVSIVSDLAVRLKFTNDEKDALIFSTENHMRFHRILEMKKSKVVKLFTNKHWNTLVSVGFADNMCRENIPGKVFSEIMARVSQIMKQLKNQKRLVNKVTGNHIMALTGLKTGKLVGLIKQEVSDWVSDQNITDQTLIDQKIMDIFSCNSL